LQNFCQVVKMRIMIKGGVWKNTEDEILKAAVMKYEIHTHTHTHTMVSHRLAVNPQPFTLNPKP